MTRQFTNLLHRAARLRQRFDAERAREKQNPLLLLRMRNLLLRLERRMQKILLGQEAQPMRFRPVLVMANRADGRI